MKQFASFIFCIALISSVFAADEPKPVKSSISDVTVFLSGAQITRHGNTTIPAGVTNLVFNDLPQGIYAESIQVNGKGSFTILSVKHQLNYLKSRQKTKEITMLQDSLELLNDLLLYEQSMLAVYAEEKSMIITNKSIGGQDAGVSIAALKETSDFFRAKLTEIGKAQLQINKKIEGIREDMSRITAQLSLANVLNNTPTSEVIVSVSAKAQTTADLTLSYLLYNCGWSPSYDVRATDISNPIDVNYKANVYQNTGEDWNKVKLTLSTGNPSQSGTKPNLTTWYLNFYVANNYGAGRGLYSGGTDYKAKASSKAEEAEGNMAMSLDEVYIEDAEEAWEYTEVSEGQTNVDYTIDIPYTIPSDNKEYAVDIQKYSLASDYEYYCAPKLDKDAFLLAKVSGWEQYNLLSGNMNIFFEGTYVGKSYLNAASTNDTLDISLGRDKNIVIDRVKLNNFSSKKTIGVNKKETIAWEINVKNKKKQDIKILIEDQFPVSSNKEIVVESIETADAKYNQVTGKLSWLLDLKPAESKKMKLVYSVKYPKDQTVLLK